MLFVSALFFVIRRHQKSSKEDRSFSSVIYEQCYTINVSVKFRKLDCYIIRVQHCSTCAATK